MGGGPVNGLAERFWEAFRVARHSADPASVEKAIDLGQAVLAAEDVAERCLVLSNLGGLLQTRYHQTGDFEFLREAVRKVMEAYVLAYESPEDSASYANNIGMLLHTRIPAEPGPWHPGRRAVLEPDGRRRGTVHEEGVLPGQPRCRAADGVHRDEGPRPPGGGRRARAGRRRVLPR
ncbi:hypothetical protein GCM10017687_53340 [Streptomyces echinatus]|uniref:hypothetical protein n=1 Tax=Streptomyces echinatus TaxID=67293 RepID=UPI0031EAD792